MHPRTLIAVMNPNGNVQSNYNPSNANYSNGNNSYSYPYAGSSTNAHGYQSNNAHPSNGYGSSGYNFNTTQNYSGPVNYNNNFNHQSQSGAGFNTTAFNANASSNRPPSSYNYFNPQYSTASNVYGRSGANTLAQYGGGVFCLRCNPCGFCDNITKDKID